MSLVKKSNVTKLRKVRELKPSENMDGWFNVITGLGTPRDKNTYADLVWQRTTREGAESLYSADEMGNKTARLIPEDGTREGVTWNMDENVDQEEVTKFIEKEFKRLGIWNSLTWTWTLSRVYGGALIFINADDGRALDKPLRVDRIKEIKSLFTIDRWEVHVNSQDIIDDLGDPDFGTPEFYNYNTSNSAVNGGETIRIHHSRVIRLNGVILPTRLYKQNNYWHDSIYGYLAHPIKNYATTHDSITSIISDFNQPVYRIEGLSEAISQDMDELVYKKLKTVDLMRSVTRAIVLDKEDEFQNVSTNVAGGKELIDLTVQRLVAGSDIPHTRLLGNSPSGLGATGEAELINYYDSVKSQQEYNLRTPIEKLTELIFNQTERPMEKPEDLDFEFNPLFQQDQERESKSRERQALSDEKYVTLGVYTAEEVAESRFGTGRYSYETVLKEGVARVYNPQLASNTSDSRPDSTPKPTETTEKGSNMSNNTDSIDILDDL